MTANFADDKSPRMWGIRTADVCAVGLIGAIFAAYSWVPLWHTDVWVHAKFGEWMVEHRALPTDEPFTPFGEEREYVNFQWLTQAALYLAYSCGNSLAGVEGGVAALRFVHASLMAGMYGLLWVALRRRGGSSGLAILGVVVTVLLRPGYMGTALRPEMVGLVMLCALLIPLSRPGLSRRALVGIPVLMVVWANAHGSYPVGLLVLGACWAGGLLNRADQFRRLSLVLAVSAVAIAFLNPHGPSLYLETLRFGDHPNLADLTEWMPLLGPPWAPGVWWGVGLAMILLTVSVFRSTRRPTVGDVLLLAGFLAMALMHRRMLTWWLLLVPWVLMPLWAGDGAWLRSPTRKSVTKIVAAVVLAVAAFLVSSPGRWVMKGEPLPMERAVSRETPWQLAAELTDSGDSRGDDFPELAEALERMYPDGFTGTILPSETQGEYLVWSLSPGLPVYLHTHFHLFSAEHWADAKTVLSAGRGWKEVLDRDGVNMVVVEQGRYSNLIGRLRASEGWELLEPPGRPGWVVALRKQ